MFHVFVKKNIKKIKYTCLSGGLRLQDTTAYLKIIFLISLSDATSYDNNLYLQVNLCPLEEPFSDATADQSHNNEIMLALLCLLSYK